MCLLGRCRPHILYKAVGVVGDKGVLMISTFGEDLWSIMVTGTAVGSVQNADHFFWWHAILLVWTSLLTGLLLCTI